MCRANVIRSQMAAAFYNSITNTHDADSAGTIVDNPDETLGERAQDHPAPRLVIATMKAHNLDLSSAKRTQLVPEMLHEYDQIINITEALYTPDWLSQAPNYTYWQVEDPMAKGLEYTSKTAEIIKQKVKDLISQPRS